MEERNDDNIFQRDRQVIAKNIPNIPKIQKPPTRLQKQAPSSLKLDQIITTANTYPFVPSSMASSSLTPIPLLSPLFLSPPISPLPQEVEEFSFPVISTDDTNNSNKDNESASTNAAGVWQHPAVDCGGYMEPSSLFVFFQSKCVIVNHAQ